MRLHDVIITGILWADITVGRQSEAAITTLSVSHTAFCFTKQK